MRDTEYLYGELDMTEIRELAYIQALLRKNNYARELIDQLLEVPYLDRDNLRIKEIGKAIKFNESLIQECYERKEDE